MKHFMSWLIALFLITPSVVLASKPVDSTSDFVTVEGTNFMLNGRPYYFAGANVYDFFTFGDGGSTHSEEAIEEKFMDKKRIDTHMARLYRDGIRVVRLWGFSAENWHGFETAPGVYNEPQFMLFDYIVYSAKRHNIRLIVTLENFWEAYGGIDKRLEWAGLPSGQTVRGRFFTCTPCNDTFKNYIHHFVTRVNHYNDIAYRDDPTIFAWELMNEPRYQNFGDDIESNVLRAWMDDLGAFIKSIDPNHLISSGIEGQGTRYGFGSNNGADFIKIHQSPYIDFTSAHPYPTEGWANLSIRQTQDLLRRWIKDSHEVVGKPFFMGEFNTEPGHGDRAAYWRAMFDVLEETNAGGSAFWWYPDRVADTGRHGVLEGSPELKVFAEHSLRMQNKSGENSVQPSSATFNLFRPEDIVVRVLRGEEAELNSIIDENGIYLLEGVDYTFASNHLVILTTYLLNQDLGVKLLRLNLSKGNSTTLKLEITNTEPEAAIEKDLFEVDSANPSEVSVNVALNGNRLEAVLLNDETLTLDQEYGFDGNRLILAQEFIAGLSPGLNFVHLVFRYGTNLSIKINVIDASIVDDFEAYSSNADLERSYYRNANGNQVQVALSSKTALSGQAMKLSYTIGQPPYAGISRKNSQDWSNFSGIQFWLYTDGSDRELTFQIHEKSGEYWEVRLPLNTGSAAMQKIPFTAFIPPSWGGVGNGRVDKDEIEDFSFYIDGQPGQGVVYIDDIKLW